MLKIANSYFCRYVLTIILIPFSILVNDRYLWGEGMDEGNVVPMKYQKTKLDNGLSIIMVEHHELPVVAIDLLVKAGSVHDPRGKSGLAHIVAQLLREGTRSKGSLEISEEIDFIGGSLSVDCEYDSSSVTTTALVRHFNTILDLVSEVARFPAFQSKDIEFHRDKAITSILREKDDKASIAGRHFSEMLYGVHPYAHPPIGTVEGLKAISKNEIIHFHKSNYLPNNSILTVVGDIDPANTLAAIKKTFGDWKKGDVPELILPSIPEINGYKIRIIDKPDLTQTEILLGYPGITRDDPDYFPIMLLNYILGRGPASRLYTRVRAEKGLTYGANSRFAMRKLRGPFYIRTYSKNETAIETLRLVLDELKKLKSNGATKEELDSAKSYFVGHFPLSMETPSQIAAKIIDQEFYGLPEDYLDKYLDNINAVSMEDIDRAIKRVLDPANVVITLVSRAEDIMEETKVLGEVELRKP
ncbi:MAG: M16 family metallopeptidase [Candidatus Scalindua sp.]